MPAGRNKRIGYLPTLKETMEEKPHLLTAGDTRPKEGRKISIYSGRGEGNGKKADK